MVKYLNIYYVALLVLNNCIIVFDTYWFQKIHLRDPNLLYTNIEFIVNFLISKFKEFVKRMQMLFFHQLFI